MACPPITAAAIVAGLVISLGCAYVPHPARAAGDASLPTSEDFAAIEARLALLGKQHDLAVLLQQIAEANRAKYEAEKSTPGTAAALAASHHPEPVDGAAIELAGSTTASPAAAAPTEKPLPRIAEIDGHGKTLTAQLVLPGGGSMPVRNGTRLDDGLVVLAVTADGVFVRAEGSTRIRSLPFDDGADEPQAAPATMAPPPPPPIQPISMMARPPLPSFPPPPTILR